MAPGSDDEPPGSGPATLAALLRGLRQRALLTQEELARRSGLSVRTIRGLELGGTRRPRSGSVRLLADALQLSERDREALVEAARGAPTKGAASAPASHPPAPAPPARTRRGARRLARRVPWWVWPVALLAPLVVLLGQAVAPAPDHGGGAPAGAEAPPPSELEPLPERIRAAGRIVVSSQDALAPIVFVDPRSGRFRGLDHDLAQPMGQRLGVEFQFRKVDFTHSFREMRAGRSDIAMSVFRDVNPAPDLDYVHYLDPGTAFLVPKGNPLRIRSRDDLCGRTVARPLTTPAEALLRQSQRCVARGRARITL